MKQITNVTACEIVREIVEHKSRALHRLCNPFDDRGQNKRIGESLPLAIVP